MKFSKSLMKNDSVNKNIKEKCIKKGEELLKDIFGIELSLNNVNGLSEDIIHESSFKYDGRNINIVLKLEDDIFLQELLVPVLVLEESKTKIIKLALGNYENEVDEIIDYLENKYELDFTPLDPEENDPNIKRIKKIPGRKFEVIFEHPAHEAEFKAELINHQCILSINSRNSIYL